ncbi:MAG TPA: hypothetical protein VLA97_11455 [Nocardioidaceae bacterium]|jgi:hypothetical protein|nr:hypothetical protein [Nocardioidaceae bacterium]
MTAQLEQEQALIPQTGAAALWRLDGGRRGHDDETPTETCRLHAWTCIWCSMEPPICGSCRPVTPPCPANGLIHTCACRNRLHAPAQESAERSADQSDESAA